MPILFYFARPDEALVIIGKDRNHQPAVVRGKRQTKFPWNFWVIWRISLKQISIEVDTDAVETQGTITNERGERVATLAPFIHIIGTAQIKIKSDDGSILRAFERFPPRNPEDGESSFADVKNTVLGYLKGAQTDIAGSMNAEDVVVKKGEFARQLVEYVRPTFNEWGLDVAYNVKSVADSGDSKYIQDLMARRAEEARRDREIAQNKADAAIQEAVQELGLKRAEVNKKIAIANREAEVTPEIRKKQLEEELRRKEVDVRTLEEEIRVGIPAEWRAYELGEVAAGEKTRLMLQGEGTAYAILKELEARQAYWALDLMRAAIDKETFPKTAEGLAGFLQNLKVITLSDGSNKGEDIISKLVTYFPALAGMIEAHKDEIVSILRAVFEPKDKTRNPADVSAEMNAQKGQETPEEPKGSEEEN